MEKNIFLQNKKYRKREWYLWNYWQTQFCAQHEKQQRKTYLVAVGTRVQSYPFKTLVTASFISLLSSWGDGAALDEDVDVPDPLISMGVAVAAVDVVTDEVGERDDKEPELSISKLSSQKQPVRFQKYHNFMNERSEPPAASILNNNWLFPIHCSDTSGHKHKSKSALKSLKQFHIPRAGSKMQTSSGTARQHYTIPSHSIRRDKRRPWISITFFFLSYSLHSIFQILPMGWQYGNCKTAYCTLLAVQLAFFLLNASFYLRRSPLN